MFSEDLTVFFADFGVPVVFTGAPDALLGNLDVADAIQAEKDGLSGVVGTVRVVLVETCALRDRFTDVMRLHIGDQIAVDGVAYTVRFLPKIDDGKLTRVYLQDA